MNPRCLISGILTLDSHPTLGMGSGVNSKKDPHRHEETSFSICICIALNIVAPSYGFNPPVIPYKACFNLEPRHSGACASNNQPHRAADENFFSKTTQRTTRA